MSMKNNGGKRVGVLADFETRSRVDIAAHGNSVYARDESTEVLCLAIADVYRNGDTGRLTVDRTSKKIWRHDGTDGSIKEFWVEEHERLFAHNAMFEFSIAKYTLGLPIEIDQLYCTQCLALYNGLPAKLDDLSKHIPLLAPKDETGHRLMLRMCKPQKDGWFLYDDEKMDRLAKYCYQDIEAEAEVLETLMPISDNEVLAYQETIKINDGGIPVDMELVETADKMTKRVIEDIQSKIPDINLNSHVALRKFADANGYHMKSVDKNHVAKALADKRLPAPLRKVLEAKSLGVGSSSVSKFSAFRNFTDDDGYLRNSYRHHGAIRTGRWTSQGVQLQNLPRGEKHLISDLDVLRGLRDAIKDEDYDKVYMMTGGRPMDGLRSVIRSTLAPPEGHMFVQRDLSAIEARGVLWVAMAEGLSIFEDFDKGEGEEPYMIFANRLNSDRFMGKQGILSSGYGVGAATFAQMCDTYGRPISEDFARDCLDLYKDMFPEVPALWKRVEKAAICAMTHENGVFDLETPTDPIRFKFQDSNLRMMLPSGRILTYWGAQLEEGNFGKPQITYMSHGSENGKAKGWHRTRTWGGSMTGHIVQGFSACLMRHILIKQREAGIPACMTTHDESVAIVKTELAQEAYDKLEVIMRTPPDWAVGLPIQSAGWINDFFLKD